MEHDDSTRLSVYYNIYFFFYVIETRLIQHKVEEEKEVLQCVVLIL